MHKREFKEQWMKCPDIETNYPGLAYLYSVNTLSIAQKHDALHDLFGNNIIGYTIYNGDGQKVFLAVKQGDINFEIKIFNSYGNEVIHLKRPKTLCVSKILIWAPPGNYIGSVNGIKCLKRYNIKDVNGNVFVKIKPRFCCVGDIYSQGEKIGEVTKCDKSIKNNDVNIKFPLQMGIEYKTILLGACFLIGY